MKNPENWKPTKYVYRNGKLRASRDLKQVALSSRLVTDIIAELYANALPIHAHGKLLDLGCGKVPLYLAYKDHVSEAICVDWENTLHPNEHLDFVCDLTQKLPFEDKEFDTVILSDVLEHIPEPEQLCREINRILSVNGMLIMNVPFYYRIHEAPHDYYRYTEFALKRFLERTQFDLVEMKTIGGSPEIIADIIAKHVQSIPLLGKACASIIQRMTGWFVRTAIGRRISIKTSRYYPLGYFVVATKDATSQ